MLVALLVVLLFALLFALLFLALRGAECTFFWAGASVVFHCPRVARVVGRLAARVLAIVENASGVLGKEARKNELASGVEGVVGVVLAVVQS